MGEASPGGWYPDPHGASGQRYWDGAEWTDHRSSVLTEAQRTAILQQLLVSYTSRGFHVAAQSPVSATLVAVTKSNDVMHFILFLMTCGLYLIVWLFAATRPQDARYTIYVDEQGAVEWRDSLGRILTTG